LLSSVRNRNITPNYRSLLHSCFASIRSRTLRHNWNGFLLWITMPSTVWIISVRSIRKKTRRNTKYFVQGVIVCRTCIWNDIFFSFSFHDKRRSILPSIVIMQLFILSQINIILFKSALRATNIRFVSVNDWNIAFRVENIDIANIYYCLVSSVQFAYYSNVTTPNIVSSIDSFFRRV